ncbi:MAG: sugar ABC transporter permease [Microvirga sp.]
MTGSTQTVPRAAPSDGARAVPAGRVPRIDGIWWFVVPGLLLYACVTLYPAASGAVQAFTKWDGFSTDMTFIGLGNFRAMLADKAVLRAVLNTLTVAFSVTVLQNAFGLLLALGINSRIRTRKLLSATFFAPAIVMPVVVAFLWQYLYAPFGVLSSLVESFGASSPDWLGDKDVALWSIIAVFVWQFSGYSMIIFIAGLQNIPPEVREAADIDGASAFQKMVYVEIPLLGPALVVNVILSLIHGLKAFDLVWVMTQGGPGDATQTLSTLIFQNAFAFNRVGYSNAIALVLAIIALPIAYVQFRSTTAKVR